jgi:hypothetical protein
MKKARAVGLLLSLTFGISVVSIPLSQALPTKFQKELSLATKSSFGKPVKLAIANCKSVLKNRKYVETCSYESFNVTVKSFEFNDLSGWPEGTPTFNVDVVMENYSKKITTGLDVGSMLKCSNSRQYSPFYSGGIDPQSLLPQSRDEGVVKMSFPEDVTLETCKDPIIWLALFSGGASLSDSKRIADIKKKKFAAFAYIEIPQSSLKTS